MGGLKIIPLFLLLVLTTYGGMQFVEANREEVSIAVGEWHSMPTPAGFVVLTSILVGMLLCGALSTIELFSLYMQNRRLKRKIQLLENAARMSTPTSENPPTDISAARASGRFT